MTQHQTNSAKQDDGGAVNGVATPRFRTLLVGTFAALALGLAMAGVYGVMA